MQACSEHWQNAEIYLSEFVVLTRSLVHKNCHLHDFDRSILKRLQCTDSRLGRRIWSQNTAMYRMREHYRNRATCYVYFALTVPLFSACTALSEPCCAAAVITWASCSFNGGVQSEMYYILHSDCQSFCTAGFFYFLPLVWSPTPTGSQTVTAFHVMEGDCK